MTHYDPDRMAQERKQYQFTMDDLLAWENDCTLMPNMIGFLPNLAVENAYVANVQSRVRLMTSPTAMPRVLEQIIVEFIMIDDLPTRRKGECHRVRMKRYNYTGAGLSDQVLYYVYFDRNPWRILDVSSNKSDFLQKYGSTDYCCMHLNVWELLSLCGSDLKQFNGFVTPEEVLDDDADLDTTGFVENDIESDGQPIH